MFLKVCHGHALGAHICSGGHFMGRPVGPTNLLSVNLTVFQSADIPNGIFLLLFVVNVPYENNTRAQCMTLTLIL